MTVQLDTTDWHDHANETLWARALGGERYTIQNVPFYAKGISYEDVVEAPTVGNQKLVRAVVQRGGHSTYRIFVTKDEPLMRFREFWIPLEDLGCTVERATERLFGVDVPPDADIYKVYDLLQAGEGVRLGFRGGTRRTPVGGSLSSSSTRSSRESGCRRTGTPALPSGAGKRGRRC